MGFLCIRGKKGEQPTHQENSTGIQSNRVSKNPGSAKDALSSRENRGRDLTEPERMQHQILSALKKFYPREKINGSDAVNFLIMQHERQWNDYEELSLDTASLRSQLETDAAKHRSKLHDLKCSHKDEQQEKQREFDLKVTNLTNLHKGEVADLKGQLDALKKKHIGDLRDQKEKTDLEFKEFNRLLIIDAGSFQPKPDTNFRNGFEALQTKVQYFSRRAKCELHCERQTLGAKFNQTRFVELAKDKHLKLVLECAFWKILCQKVFRTPFGVLGEYGDSLFTTWHNFWTEQVEEPSAYSWPAPNSRAERWRSSTFEVLQNVIMAKGSEKADNSIVVESYKRNCSAISTALRATFSQVSHEEVGKFPEEIAELACALALEIGAARCRYQLCTIAEGTIFSRENRDLMRDRNEGSELGMAEYVVKLFVSPGLLRIGDGRGQSFDRELLHLHAADVYGIGTGEGKEA